MKMLNIGAYLDRLRIRVLYEQKGSKISTLSYYTVQSPYQMVAFAPR